MEYLGALSSQLEINPCWRNRVRARGAALHGAEEQRMQRLGATGDEADAWGDFLDWLGQEQTPPTNPAPTPATGGPSTYPGFFAPAPFRPGNWDIIRGEYVVGEGETLYGIAATYLGRGDRQDEIRALQTHADWELGPNGRYLNRYTSKWSVSSTAPGHIYQEGIALVMPPEAVQKAQQLGANPNVVPAATTPGAPGTRPNAPPPPGTPGATTGKTASGMSRNVKLGLAAAAGLAAYFVAT